MSFLLEDDQQKHLVFAPAAAKRTKRSILSEDDEVPETLVYKESSPIVKSIHRRSLLDDDSPSNEDLFDDPWTSNEATSSVPACPACGHQVHSGVPHACCAESPPAVDVSSRPPAKTSSSENATRGDTKKPTPSPGRPKKKGSTKREKKQPRTATPALRESEEKDFEKVSRFDVQEQLEQPFSSFLPDIRQIEIQNKQLVQPGESAVYLGSDPMAATVSPFGAPTEPPQIPEDVGVITPNIPWLHVNSIPHLVQYIGELHAQMRTLKPVNPPLHEKPPELTRLHISRLLCGTFPPFRPCVAGPDCHALNDFGIEMMEWLSEAEYDRVLKTKHQLIATRRLCYICTLIVVQRSYNEIRNSGNLAGMVALPFTIIVGKEGEYASSAVLQSTGPTGVTPNLTSCLADCPHIGPDRPCMLGNIRFYNSEQYTMGQVVVENRLVSALIESQEADVVYITPNATPPPPPLANPHIKRDVSYCSLPDTLSILVHFFSADNSVHLAGRERIWNFGVSPVEGRKALEIYHATGFVLSPLFWCAAPARISRPAHHTPLPWSDIFCSDISVTARRCAEIMEMGRITPEQLAEGDLCFLVDPEDYPFPRPVIPQESLHWHALHLRVGLARALLAVYPNSKNSEMDMTVRSRLQIFIKWHNCHREYLSPTEEPSEDTLRMLREIPVPQIVYAADFNNLRAKVTIRTGLSPASILQNKYPAHADLFDGNFDAVVLGLREGRLYSSTDEGQRFSLDPPYGCIVRAALLRINLALRFHEESYADLKRARKAAALHPQSRIHASAVNVVVRTRYILRMFLYTHLRLMERVMSRGLYSDEALRTPVAGRQYFGYSLTHYDETKPNQHLTLHQGMLIDLTRVIQDIPFPNPKRPRDRGKNMPLLHRALYAFLPKAPVGSHPPRNNSNLQRTACLKSAPYRLLTSFATLISFVGAYVHADFIPDFRLAVGAYQQFVLRAKDKDRFLTWQKNHEPIVTLAMREYIVHSIQCMTGYRQYLVANYPFYLQFERKIRGAANHIFRRMMAVRTPLSEIEHTLQTAFKAELDSSRFSAKLHRRIERHVGFEPLDFSSTRKETAVNDLVMLYCHLQRAIGARCRDDVQPLSLPTVVRKQIEARVSAIPIHTKIDLMILREFTDDNGPLISTDTIRTLHDILAVHIPLEKGKKIEALLAAIPPYELDVVNLYFSHMYTRNRVFLYPLDQKTAAQQYAAVKQRYRTSTQQGASRSFPLSPLIFALVIKTCCGDLANFVNQVERTPNAYGLNGMAWDPFTNTCVDKPKRVKQKAPRINREFYTCLEYALMSRDNRQVAKLCARLTKQSTVTTPNRPQCGKCEVVPFHMLGMVALVVTAHVRSTIDISVAAYFICPKCGGFSTFSTKHYGVNGLECVTCTLAQNKALYTPFCIICGKQLNHQKRWHSYLVVDDLPPAYHRPEIADYRFKVKYICERCHRCKTAKYAEYGHLAHTASQLVDLKHYEAKNCEVWCLQRSMSDPEEFLRQLPASSKGDVYFTTGRYAL